MDNLAVRGKSRHWACSGRFTFRTLRFLNLPPKSALSSQWKSLHGGLLHLAYVSYGEPARQTILARGQGNCLPDRVAVFLVM